jgi:kynurenine formamidase
MNWTLSELAQAAEHHRNWGRWGEDDQIGTLNYVTADTVLAGRDEIRLGQVFSLAIDLGPAGPQTTGAGRRFNPIHWMLEAGTDLVGEARHGYADDVIQMCVHGATHWDGLGHQFYDGKMWNGYDKDLVNSKGVWRNAITNVRDRLTGRCVLADVARWRGVDTLAAGEQIRGADLDACLDAQGVSVRPGDILLIRTGQIEHGLRDGWGNYAGGNAPGLTLDTAAWLKDKQVAALATDTWGAEVRPNELDGIVQPWHKLAIVSVGLTVGEMFNLGALAAACAQDGRYSFFVSAGALPIEGGTGSPVNPLAIR